MRRVRVDTMPVGAKLARTVFSSEGGVLLMQGIELKENYLELLKRRGVNEIYLEDDLSEGIEVHDVINENTRNEAVTLVRKIMTEYSFFDTVDVENVKSVVNKIVDELLSNDDILYNLTEIKTVDDYTFGHSVSVCILSLITGIGIGLDTAQLRELGIGAILHDIGKLCIPRDILTKPCQLTIEEFEEIKKHTLLGYELLKRSGQLNLISSYIALGHHERYDGSGYPLRLKNGEIQLYARIVAVADVYDALTSDRVYRKKLKPHEVYEYITSLGIHHFDPLVVENFVKFVTVYPVGTGVMLNTRERAVVVKHNRKMPTRPLVRIVYDEDMKRLSKEIDLSRKEGFSS